MDPLDVSPKSYEQLLSENALLRAEVAALSLKSGSSSIRERQAQLILDEMLQFVVLLDLAGNVVDINRATVQEGGVRPEEILGHPFWKAHFWQASIDGAKRLQSAIAMASAGEYLTYETDIYGAASGKQAVTIDLSLSPLHDDSGRIMYLLAEGRNITERKGREAEGARKERELRNLYDKLRSFDRLKAEVFADVSHELRTPLTLILGPVRRRLARPDVTDAERRDLEVVARNASLLLKHVNNLLDLSKLAADGMIVQYARTDLARLTRLTASHFNVLAEERRVRLTVETPDALRVQLDPEKIQRVLLNLIANALKFTPPGGAVTVELIPDGDAARLSVRDTGPGVPANLRDVIFERFRRGDLASVGKIEGTGLGLAIVKEFVDLHRGSVSVEEPPGGGAQFTVRLPLVAPAGTAVAADGTMDEDAPRLVLDELRPRRPLTDELMGPASNSAPLVLVVEDNRDMSDFIAQTLSVAYKVVCASDGSEGLRKAIELHPDLILTDVMMPRMGGEQMLREIRARRELDGIPIVLLTGNSDADVRVSLLKEGAIGYLNKPFTAEELLAKVDRFVTERRRSQATLQDAYTLLHAVTEGINDTVFVKDLQGRYLMINSAGAADLGHSVDAVVGKDDTEFFGDESARKIREADREVMESGETRTFEDETTNAAGTRYYLATKGPYRDHDGSIIGLVGISRDITERKQTERELREAKEAAEAASKAKDHFLAVLSHELRTPLTPVLATVTVCEARADLPEEVRQSMSLIRRNVEMEARLIDDLLDLTRISRGKIELHYEALDAHASLRRAVEICQPDIEAKRLEVSLCLWAERHFIWADPARMQQVFWNLLNNSVKFTPQGGRITLVTSNEEGSLAVEVADTGVGIEPDVLPRIFAAFEQGEVTVTRRFGGLGLGLAISKAIVDMHHGSLSVASEGRGRGASFTLRLDCIATTTVREEAPPRAPNKSRLGPCRMLLVEDHEDTLVMMSSLLELFGYSVQTASTVRDAISLGVRENFDLLISDIGLPDGSGLDIMRQLKRKRSLRGIALSGFGMEEDLQKSREAGFEVHLTKPVNFQTLERVIEQVAG